MQINPTWDDIAEEKPPTWDDVAEEKAPTWDDVDNREERKAALKKPELESTFPFNALGTLSDVLIEPTANIPAAIYNLPADVANYVAGKQIIRPVGRGESVVPEVLPSADVVSKWKWPTLPNPNPGAQAAEWIKKTDTTPQEIGPVAGGLVKGGEDLIRGIATPEVIMTAGGAAPESLLSRAPAATFAGQMIQHTPESYAEFGKQTVEGSPAEAVRSGVGALGSSAIIGHIAAKGVGANPIEYAPKPPTAEQIAIDRAAVEALNADNPAAKRQLGIRIPEGEFAQPGILPLADAALRQAQGPNILKPGEEPALLQLRREINPRPIVQSGNVPRSIERQAGETVVQPTLEGAKVQPGFERTASDLLQERDRTGALQGRPEFTAPERQAFNEFIAEEAKAGRYYPDAPYRRPATPDAQRIANEQAKANVEKGLTDESGYYLDEPTRQTLPEPTPPPQKGAEATTLINPETGRRIVKPTVLSNLQKARLRKALERGADEETIRNIMRVEEGKPAQTWREDLNAWADKQIESQPPVGSMPDPAWATRRVTALGIKGAFLIEKGITNFKDWSLEMVRQFGDWVKPSLQNIWEQANKIKEGGINALDKETAQSIRALREVTGKSEGQMPGEATGGKADVRGDQQGPAKAKEIADQLGAEFKGDLKSPNRHLWQFELKNRDGTSATAISVPAGSTVEQVRAKYQAKIDEYRAAGDEARAPRAPKAATSEIQSIMDMTPDEFAKWKVDNKLGPETTQRIADSLTPEDYARVRAEADRLAEQTKKVAEKAGSEKFTEETIKTLEENSKVSTKAQTLREIAEDYKKSNPEVESVTPLDPASGSPKSNVSAFLEKADARLAQVQEQIRKGFYKGQTAMGVPAAVLDTALQAARLSLRAGKTVAEAIEAAIKHIKFNVKNFNEAEVRKMFENELGAKPNVENRNVGTPVAGVQPNQRGTATKTPAQTLEGIKKIFEPTKKPGTSLKQKGINIIEAFRTGISSKFRPLNKLSEDIAKAYGLTSRRDIAGIMEQLKGSQGKAEADIYRFDRDVSKLVKGDEADFNSYIFLRRSLDRLEQDMKDINRAIAGEDVKDLNRRSVAQYTINELTPALDLLKQKLGPAKLAKFEQASDAYQRHMDQALRLQVESGRMAPEVYDAIKNGNQFYAPFKVMKYIEDTMRPEGSGRRIDTVADYTKAMKGIEDPDFKLGDMLAAARQGISMSRILSDKNNAMRAVAELAAFDPNGTFIKKLKPTEDPPKGMDAINVLESGKKERYAVDTGVAEALQSSGGQAGSVLLKAMAYGAVPFRAGATALNLPFQVSNLLADVPRQALVSKFGIQGVNDLWKYPSGFVKSLYSSIAGDVFGKDNKLFLDFLDSGVAGTTVQEYLTPNALKFQESSRLSRGKKMASTVINLIPEFAKAIEQTSKVLGVQRAMEFHGVKSGKELAAKFPEAITELRRFSGSPDFGRQGKAIEAAKLNMLYMFLNARIQGAIADVGRLSGMDGAKTAARTWRNLAFAVGIPTAFAYWMNNRPENKDDYDRIPVREKQNYWHIPKNLFSGEPQYITTDDGEKIRDYWRIPKRETSKWIANFTESAINFAEKKNPQAAKEFAANMIQEITPVNIQGENTQERLESVAAGTHPFVKSALELATGRDLYRHRSIIPDTMKDATPEQQFKPSTSEAYKKLAEMMPDVAPEFLRSPLLIENLTKNMTAGLVTQFLPRKPVEGRSKLENIPLIARFQAAPYTDDPKFKQEMKDLKREAADESLARHRAATKLIDDNPGKDLGAILEKAGPDEKLMRHVADLWIGKQNGITFPERQLLALPTKQRAAWVANQLKGLDPVEQQNKIMELSRKRILTEDVFEQLPAEMQ